MYAFLVEKAAGPLRHLRRGGDADHARGVARVRRPVELDPRRPRRRRARELHVVHAAHRRRRRGTAAASSSSGMPRTAARPTIAQGAAQALEDALVLTELLVAARRASTRTLWDDFHARRLPRATRGRRGIRAARPVADRRRPRRRRRRPDLRHRARRWRSPHDRRRPRRSPTCTRTCCCPSLHAEVERRAPDGVRGGRRARAAAATAPRAWRCRARWSARASRSSPTSTARLAAMDAQGVDRQWVSASPNHFYPWAPEGLAVWAANEANRLVAAHVAQAPDRLTGLGLVPLQHPRAHRRVPRRRRARPRPRGRRDLVVRGRRRAVGPAARAVLGARRRARRGRLPAPVRLQPRRAPRPLLPRPTPWASPPRTPSPCRT